MVQELLDDATWKDIATVTGPAQRKRRTIIAAALKQAGRKVEDSTTKVRVLDEDAARVFTVEPEPPAAPRLRIR